MREVPGIVLLGAIALSIAGCGGTPPPSAGAPASAAVPAAAPGGTEPGSSPPEPSPPPLPPGPAAPTATLHVGFAGIVNTIEVSAVQPQPLRAAALVMPDGTLVPANYITVSANPRIMTGQWVLSQPWNAAVNSENALAALALPEGQTSAALRSDQQLLAMVSRAELPLTDPVGYRRDWRDWRVRLTFGTPPGQLETLVIAAPEPPPQ